MPPPSPLAIITRAHKSRLALSRQADAFFWWRSTRGDEVFACFNAAITVTAETLIRWFNLLTPIENRMGIIPVDVECWKYLRYQFKPSGAEAALESSTLISPGDYAFYPIDEGIDSEGPWHPFLGYYELSPHARVEEWMVNDMSPEGRAKHQNTFAISELDRQAVMELYPNGCPFTGSAWNSRDGCVDVHWIYPPSLRGSMAVGLFTNHPEQEELKMMVTANMMPMRSDVYELWIANAISVDVDDGYKIIAFNETARECTNLGTELAFGSNIKRDNLLREHLRYTLGLRVIGGHVLGDFSLSDIADFFKIAKIGEDGQPVNPEDAEWKTSIGEVVLEELQVRPRKPTKATSFDEEDSNEGIPEINWNEVEDTETEDEENEAEAAEIESNGSYHSNDDEM